MAQVQGNLGYIYSISGRYDLAESQLQAALTNYTNYRTLAKQNPTLYVPQVATALDNLALVEFDQNDFPKAEEYEQEALQIRRNLWKENPQSFSEVFAKSLLNMSSIRKEQKAPCAEILNLVREARKLSSEQSLNEHAKSAMEGCETADTVSPYPATFP